MRTAEDKGTFLRFEEVYALYRGSVLRYLSRRCAAFHDAEDLTEQVFEYVYKKLDTYDPEKASVKNWVFMICVSRWKNYCRDRRISCDLDAVSGFMGDDESDLGKAIWLGQVRDALAKALEQLPDVQKRILIMKYFQNASYEEIARRTLMSESNVRVYHHRALAKLQKMNVIRECV